MGLYHDKTTEALIVTINTVMWQFFPFNQQAIKYTRNVERLTDGWLAAFQISVVSVGTLEIWWLLVKVIER